ncbi:MAG: hypothetical protein ACRESZ_18735, partial [Methylococcales bacterium]
MKSTDPEALLSLSVKQAFDLKAAMERLNRNPANSSKPTGSLAPGRKNTIKGMMITTRPGTR